MRIMTREVKKLSERRTLDGLVAALGLRLDAEPEPTEAPDFLLRAGGRRIGVEITTYRSGATVGGSTELRVVESEWERFKAASDEFRAKHADLRDVNVGLMFKTIVPPRRQHATFLAEVASFVRERAAMLSSADRTYWPQDFASPLMREYVSTLYLRVDRYAEWHSNLAGGYVARPDETISAIVAEKSAKKFCPADELWLAVECGTRISEMMLDLMGVEDFEAVPSLEPYAFARVFVLAYTGAYEWRRGAGWRKLGGESSEDQRTSSFDDFKKVIDDPEWLIDPERKAAAVAEECLSELHKNTEGA
jgi:hypothetical protein